MRVYVDGKYVTNYTYDNGSIVFDEPIEKKSQIKVIYDVVHMPNRKQRRQKNS